MAAHPEAPLAAALVLAMAEAVPAEPAGLVEPLDQEWAYLAREVALGVVMVAEEAEVAQMVVAMR
jgi:hypothetical protein